MSNMPIGEQARFIFATDKLIHDRISKIQDQCLMSRQGSRFGELSITQLHVIREIRQNGRLSMSELAQRLGVSPPSASTMVDRLVEKKVLFREHSPKDRRKVMVAVSPEAVKEIKSLEDRILHLFEQLVRRLGTDMAQQWCTVLDQVKSALAEEFDRPNQLN